LILLRIIAVQPGTFWWNIRYKTVVPVPVQGQIAEIPLTMPRTAKSIKKSLYFIGTTAFKAPQNPGTYYYLCQMPGHAKSGMYGKCVVAP